MTPFLLNYPAEPFVRFSWKKPDGSGFFPQYDAIREITKVAGEPLFRPFTKLGELIIREREAKLAKKNRFTSQLYQNNQ